MAKKIEPRAKMNLWGSFLSPRRANSYALRDVVRKIEAAGVNAQRRQLGNIVNDLRNFGEHDLIDELKLAVDAYNEEVQRFNNYVVFLHAVNNKLRRYKRTEAFQIAYETTFPYGVWGAASEYQAENDPVEAADRALRQLEYHMSSR